MHTGPDVLVLETEWFSSDSYAEELASWYAAILFQQVEQVFLKQLAVTWFSSGTET